MKTITFATTSKLAAGATQPGYLIRISWPAVTSPVLPAVTERFSTLTTMSWNGSSWGAADITVSGISQDGAGSGTATLHIGNTDLAMSAMVLARGASDIPVDIWTVYSTTPALADPVQVFSGVTNGADISADQVILRMTSQNNNTLYSPRVFINKSSGFNFLQPAGTKIAWGTEIFELER